MIKYYLNNQKGATIIASGLLIVSLLGFAGLVADVGNIYLVKAKMQDTVDAAALAGVQEAPRSDAAKRVASKYVMDNNKSDDSESPLIIWNGKENKITVTLKKQIPTNFMKLFGYKRVPITVRAVAIAGVEGDSEEYAFFTNKSMNFFTTDMRGKIYSGGDIHYYGLEENPYNYNKLTGSVEAMGSIIGCPQFKTLKGEDGKVKEKNAKQEMPKYKIPTDTKPCTKAKLTAVDLAGGPLFVKGGTTVELGSDVTGGTIISDGVIEVRTTDLTMKNPLEKLFIYTSGAAIRLNFRGTTNINATVYVPNGKISLLSNKDITINGSVVANEIRADVGGSMNIFGPSGGGTAGKHPMLLE